MRLRAGKTGSGKGAGRMVTQAIATARAAGVRGQILVRGDSAYGTRAVVGACRSHGARFSVVMTRNSAIDRAITSIDESTWTPVKYPGAVRDPDTGGWISDAEVAEISYTAFTATKDRFTARLVVRRVKDARFRDALFPVWRYHPFFTNTDLPTAEADITHRQHAIIETVFADLIDGPLAHMPSGRFGANSAWVLCAAIAHNLLRAAGVLAGGAHAVARGATLRRKLVTSRHGWPGHSADRSCTYPHIGLGQITGSHCGATPSATVHQPAQPSDHPPNRPYRRPQEKLGRPVVSRCPRPRARQESVPRHLNRVDPRIEAKNG
jgi:hypothetical protein